MLTTPGGDSNLDNIIKKNFFTEIQQRRVKTEIQYLKELDQNCFKVSLQSTPIGLKILVSITKNFILKEIKEAEKFVFPIVFEFLLEPKFPFVFPKLLCKTSFFTPNLADGRDFVEDVIQRMWNPSILLRDVVVYIPDFLKRLIQLTIPEESQLLGKYYLGHLYNLEDFLTMDTAHVFPGTEMINEQSVNNERYFIIIESFFLNFESVDKARNTLRLISWAHIQAVSRIKRNKDDPKMLVFLWHDNDKKGVLVQNVFITDQAIEMVETIVRMGQKYAKVTETIKKQRDLPLAEVTAKNYRDMDIEELLENIAILESKLEAEPTISEINLLMTLYQKAVEYFSALNDPAYSEFVEKLHDLLTREDIQVILKSGEGNQAGQGKKGSASKKLREKPKASPAKGEVGVPDQFREPEESRHTPSREPKKRATPQKKEEPAIKKEEQQPVVEVQHYVPVQENKQKPNEEQIVVSADTEAEKAAEAAIEKKEEKQEEKQIEQKEEKQEEQQEVKLEERHEEKRVEQPEKQEEQKEEQQEVKQEEKQEEQQEEQQEVKPEEKQEAQEEKQEKQEEQQEVQEEKQQEAKPEEKQEEQQAEVQEEKQEEKQEEHQEEKQEEKQEEQQEEKQKEEEKVEPTESNKVEEEKAEEKPEEAEKPEEVEVEQPKTEEPAPVEVNHQEEQEKEKKPEPEKEKEEEKEEETTKHTNNEEHTKPMDNFIPPANDDMFDIGDDDD